MFITVGQFIGIIIVIAVIATAFENMIQDRISNRDMTWIKWIERRFKIVKFRHDLKVADEKKQEQPLKK